MTDAWGRALFLTIFTATIPLLANAQTPASNVRFTREWSSRLLLDTQFDGENEDVVENWNLARLTLDYRADSRWRAFMSGWLRYGVAAEQYAENNKWAYDIELREGYVDYTYNAFNIKIGQRIFTWGKNETAPPSDVLNPADLRYDPLAGLNSPTQLKVPVFALDASYSFAAVTLQAVVLPFFHAHKAFILGRDFAIVPRGSATERQLYDFAKPNLGVQDQLQQGMLGLGHPAFSPANMSVALRAISNLAGWDLAATAYYGWDRTPRWTIDPDLQLLLLNAGRLFDNPDVLFSDADVANAIGGVQRKQQAGDALISSKYRRMWVLAAEAEGVLGDIVVRADVGYVPAKTFYTYNQQLLWCQSARAILGAEYTRGETLFISAAAHSSVIFNCPRSAPIFGFERISKNAPTADWAALMGTSLTLRYTLTDQDIILAATGLYNFAPGDVVANMYGDYTGFSPHILRAGAVLVGGHKNSLAHRYANNDIGYVEYRVVW